MSDTPNPVPASSSDDLTHLLATILQTPPTTPGGLLSDAKSLLTSRTVICALIGIVAAFLKDHGTTISATDQASLVTDVLSLIQYGGLVGAILFRVLATKAIS